MARSLFAAGGVQDTLQTIVDVAVTTIGGCDFAGIFTAVGEQVTTAGFSDNWYCKSMTFNKNAAKVPVSTLCFRTPPFMPTT